VVEAYKGIASEVLEKEAAVPPLRIRLEHVLELKLTRILFKADHKNPVFERLKKNKKLAKKIKAEKKKAKL
jgi:aromatic ring-opening dioxygenase LigB subunit